MKLADKVGRAGVSFAMLRHTEGSTTARDAVALLLRRAGEIQAAIKSLPLSAPSQADILASLRELNAQLDAYALTV